MILLGCALWVNPSCRRTWLLKGIGDDILIGFTNVMPITHLWLIRFNTTPLGLAPYFAPRLRQTNLASLEPAHVSKKLTDGSLLANKGDIYWQVGCTGNIQTRRWFQQVHWSRIWKCNIFMLLLMEKFGFCSPCSKPLSQQTTAVWRNNSTAAKLLHFFFKMLRKKPLLFEDFESLFGNGPKGLIRT